MGVNDVSEAVVEVAWAALNTQQGGELKDLLAAEVLENDKLRKSLQVYKKVIEDLELADAVAAASIEEPSSNSASTASSQVPGTPDMYDRLRDKLSSSDFLQQLASSEGEKTSDPSVMRGGDQEGGLWLFVSDEKNLLPKEERDELGINEGYVVITQQDIVDGVACFVARSISSLPQSKNMNPDELQQAIISAFSELQKTGKLRNLWSCAHLLYAATSWGSSALGHLCMAFSAAVLECGILDGLEMRYTSYLEVVQKSSDQASSMDGSVHLKFYYSASFPMICNYKNTSIFSDSSPSLSYY